MPTEITTSVHTTPIKWNEDEWNKIAVQLYQLKGTHALASEGVNDIKAKDVFEAQNVLPAERRRKQISIAQGFQQIRERLRGLFERVQKENFLRTTTAAQTKASRRDTTPAVVQALTDVLIEEPHALHTANRDRFAEGSLVPHDANDEAGHTRTFEEGRVVDVRPGHEAEAHPSRKAVEQRVEGSPQSATIAPATSAPDLENVRSPISVENYGGRLTRQAEQSTPNLTELARPFVAMACEELARALVQAFTGHERFSSPPKLQTATVRTTRQFEEPGYRRNPQRPSSDIHAQRTDDDPRAGRADEIEARDDEVGYPTEVQPLFDPKLPPSANSDFKPMIGLVATRGHEYEDLQLLYPQLRFSIVPVEGIRGPEAFQNCQRVIGLREEVPQATEEVLKRTLGYRYVWLRGGVDRVREQLDAWLANPSSMQTGPRAAGPRGDKVLRQGNGKKRAKWPPRVA
ncbi:hypothetical protein [Noviherbaspirillum pedocola]|uniref:Uncharacterized protein n=1 Tax=Noviherbaspirillum pedocola TaxID=2801341 RepID=A0A934T497_9BURK|nr:hypothetical protein [Noviherbaspirillum pedocola]MBK4739163.1 hypothetical protein [Noviherbaspirillum pedocola]